MKRSMQTQKAPVIIFVYRREISGLLEQLRRNPEAPETDLYVFSDGSKNGTDRDDVLQTRASLQNIGGFRSVTVAEAGHNRGLANSIISGVTRIVSQYGRGIVLEDDLSVADDFLRYMNEALAFYEDDPKVWSIAGYGAEMPCLKKYTYDVYLAPRVSSWGWATWRDRWQRVDWEIRDWEKIRGDKVLQDRFNGGGNDLFKMLELQMLGKIDSWAIRWTYNQFKCNMYTVYPVVSKVSNEGFSDKKGMHNNQTAHEKWRVTLQAHSPVTFEKLDVDPAVAACFKKYYDLGFRTVVGYFLKKHGGYDVAKIMMRLLRG